MWRTYVAFILWWDSQWTKVSSETLACAEAQWTRSSVPSKNLKCTFSTAQVKEELILNSTRANKWADTVGTMLGKCSYKKAAMRELPDWIKHPPPKKSFKYNLFWAKTSEFYAWKCWPVALIINTAWSVQKIWETTTVQYEWAINYTTPQRRV